MLIQKPKQIFAFSKVIVASERAKEYYRNSDASKKECSSTSKHINILCSMTLKIHMKE